MSIINEFWYKKAQGEVKTLYHGTSIEFAQQILEDKVLKPRSLSGIASQDIGIGLPSREDCVYVTENYEEAVSRTALVGAGEGGVVFTVEAKPEDLYLDEDSVWSLFKRSAANADVQLYLEQYLETSSIDIPTLEAFVRGEDMLYGEINDEIKQLTEWIEDNDPVMKTAIILSSLTKSYCLKQEVPIVDFTVTDNPYEFDDEGYD